MYESQFQLKRRPFAATPDPKCFLALGSVQGALDELVVCVEQGQGVAVVSAPAGTGKTLLCERLRVELEERFETVFLRHASFLTRRALLQTILADLNHSYRRHDEQELRLELIPAIQALSPHREALVLLCDEAHMLSEDLLEELRMLSDLAEHGRPLVRLVLVGQPALEETLAQPGLEALNQRIRAHICLDTFDRTMSHEYIDYRITWAGGRTPEVFTPEAMELIVRASEGVPRCINQLCDHALLLAYVAEQKPVPVETIREALRDLRQLPLHWNENLLADASILDGSSDAVVTVAPATLDEPAHESLYLVERATTSAMQSVEFGADLPSNQSLTDLTSREIEHSLPDACHSDDVALDEGSAEEERVELDLSESEQVPPSCAETDDVVSDESIELEPEIETPQEPEAVSQAFARTRLSRTDITVSVRSNEVVEELVCDRYAAIDGGYPMPELPTAMNPTELAGALESPDCSHSPLPAIPETVAPEELSAVELDAQPEVALAMEPAAELSSETIPAADTLQSCEAVEAPETVEAVAHVEPEVESVGETEDFASVCTRLEGCLPKVVDGPAWDSTALEFGTADESVAPPMVASTESDDWDSIEAELGVAVCEIAQEIRSEIPDAGGRTTLQRLQEHLTPETQAGVISVEIGVDSNSFDRPQPDTAALDRRIEVSGSGRPFRNLFTQLRRKQQGLL